VNPKLKVASMFAGCGGLDFAFHKQTERYKVVHVSDFDKDSCTTYEKYYNMKSNCEDITTVKTIPDCDILTGGFPRDISQLFSSVNNFSFIIILSDIYLYYYSTKIIFDFKLFCKN